MPTKPDNHNRPWTDADDYQLIDQYTDGKSIKYIAKYVGRTPAAVSYRLQVLRATNVIPEVPANRKLGKQSYNGAQAVRKRVEKGEQAVPNAARVAPVGAVQQIPVAHSANDTLIGMAIGFVLGGIISGVGVYAYFLQ